MLNKIIYLVLLMLILGRLTNRPLSPGRELVSDCAEQKITLPHENADVLALLPPWREKILPIIGENVHPSFSELTNAVNSANHKVLHHGHISSDSSFMFMRPPKPLFLLDNHLII